MLIAILTHWATWMHLSMSILGLLLYVASTHALQQRRHPAAAMSWILSFFFVPYLALPAYFFFGQRKMALTSRIGSAHGSGPPPADGRGQWLSSMLQTLGAAPSRDGVGLTLHHDGGEAEQALWATMDRAEHSIHVCTYLIGDDRIGRLLIERLAAHAARGIDVRLLLDGVGGLLVRRHRLAPLLKAGGHVARAFPPLRRLLHRQSNFRNHRKQVVVDARHLWMGGRNFADEYFVGSAHQPAWIDLSLHVSGDVARDAQAVFLADWRLATGVDAPLPRFDQPAASGRELQLVASGPDQSQDGLQALLVTGCYRAQSRIRIVTPYLIPDPALQQALGLAARREVAVDIVLPARSNHVLADAARHRALRELAAAGVSVWLVPDMVHGKAVVFDDVALAGSANLDIRSLFLNFELTMVLYEPRVAEDLAQWIDRLRADAQPYRPQPVSMLRDLYEGAVLWLGFQL
ncbi:MAG TPA: phospholipase D-like domain-containing protein [Burkholderiaceae bacterium]|nr:phospholipase D-like domain-containing protein [Burkholderiaceae bacterium]